MDLERSINFNIRASISENSNIDARYNTKNYTKCAILIIKMIQKNVCIGQLELYLILFKIKNNRVGIIYEHKKQRSLSNKKASLLIETEISSLISLYSITLSFRHNLLIIYFRHIFLFLFSEKFIQELVCSFLSIKYFTLGILR